MRDFIMLSIIMLSIVLLIGIMLSVIILSVTILSGIMLSVNMLSAIRVIVMASKSQIENNNFSSTRFNRPFYQNVSTRAQPISALAYKKLLTIFLRSKIITGVP